MLGAGELAPPHSYTLPSCNACFLPWLGERMGKQGTKAIEVACGRMRLRG